MATLRDKLATRCQPLLPDQTTIRHVFMCQTGPSPYLMFLTYLIIPWVNYRIVCVSDDAIYLVKAKKWMPSSPTGLIATLPREQRLGPVSGLWGQITLMDERHWVNKRFHKDVDAADAALR